MERNRTLARAELDVHAVARLALVIVCALGGAGRLSFCWAGTSPSQLYFGIQPPHAALPTGGECAQMLVGSSTWEPRPENARANTARIDAGSLAAFHANPLNFIDGAPAADFQQVNGDYSGTTDMIIRWAACKWGMDETVLRAEAYLESNWGAYRVGDLQTSPYSCSAGMWLGWQPAGFCWDSFGIGQIKLMSFNAWPMAWTSTAFNLDLRGAYFRACMNGDIGYYNFTPPSAGYPWYSSSDDISTLEWGCVGSWFSGQWYDNSALNYIQYMESFVAEAPWRAWPTGSSASLQLYSPVDTQVVAGVVPISIYLNQNDPAACYACWSIDDLQESCTPAAGPWYWDTTQYVLNGMHAVSVDAYSCNSAVPNYHAGIDVVVAN